MQTVAIQDAPQLLNTNDQAMWVLGYNEAVQKMLSRGCTESEQHMQELRAYELTVSNLRAELESVRQGQCLHKIAEPATQAVQPVATITGVDEFGPMFGWYEHWAKFNVGTKLYTHPTPQGLDAQQLHSDIMNLPCVRAVAGRSAVARIAADVYKQGFRDARHAAAELVLAAQAKQGA